MVDTIDILNYQTLTAAINEIKSPSSFLFNLIFGQHINLLTETAELSTYIGKRKAAPLVRKNGQAQMVVGTSAAYATIETPHTRIKMPFSSQELMFKRRPGIGIYEAGSIEAAAKASVARDLSYMADQITNLEEILASQVLQGKISYSVNEGEQFQLTLPRTGSLVVNESGTNPWNSTGSPGLTIRTARRQLADLSGLQPTHAFMNTNVAEAFLNNAEVKALMDNRRMDPGAVNLQAQFQESGAIYHGTVYGIQFWEYPRTIEDAAGNTVSLIRDKYVEIVSITPGAQFVTYYGAIPEIQGTEMQLFVGERFSKAWIENDPPVVQHLASSRPLPWARRADVMKSVQVIP